MNRRDVSTIAHALNVAHNPSFHAQSKATAWAFCIEAVADALAQCSKEFDREAFIAECRAPLPQEEV